MNDIFWIDESRKFEITYDKLIKLLNNTNTFSRCIQKDNPFDFFMNLILGLINEKEIVILDSDFSEDEIKELGLDKNVIKASVSENKIMIKSKEELIKSIIKQESKSSITLFTSGTTGKPKRVVHRIENLLRSIRINPKFNDDVWAFAYNPTHFAGLQVFFQAIVNGNSLIYVFNNGTNIVKEVFEKYEITRISATPTYYRNIISQISNEVLSVKSVTSGGEKFDSNMAKHINEIFPNAKIRNVYASTEAGSLFSSCGDMFKVSPRIKNKVKISQENELLIHRSLVGESEDLNFENDYYNTGDSVEFVDEFNFKFLSRNSDFINVGGYRVNPLEIEAVISELDSVNDVVVYGRKNSVIGNLIVADIVKSNKSMSDKEVKVEVMSLVSQNLQDYKRPRIIKIVDELSQTRTGKKVRNLWNG